MKVSAIKTNKITAGSISLLDLLDEYLPKLQDNTVVAITSKVVSLCENNVLPIEGTDKETLVTQESDMFLPSSLGKYGYHFTVTNNTLISLGGIDESNGDNNYVLWPQDPQKTANEVREHLCARDSLKHVGVVITDSTCQPMRVGTTGIALAHSGFKSVNDYRKQPDLFGRPFSVARANVSGGLAATSVLVMGEGSEQTPLCVITDVDFVAFQDHNPNSKELAETHMPFEDDLFYPFFSSIEWQPGQRKK